MADITALEERCLRIVAVADQHAKDVQRKLEKENALLRKQLADAEDTYYANVEHVDTTLRQQLNQLQHITHQFLAAHKESTQMIHHAAASREEVEARALARLKELLYNYLRFASLEQRRQHRATLFAAVKHFSTSAKMMLPNLKASSVKEIRDVVRGGYSAMVASHGSSDNDAEAQQGEGNAFERFLAAGGALDDGFESNNEEDASDALERLVEQPMGRGVAALAMPMHDAASATAAFSPAMHATVMYLIGAADLLDRFGDVVTERVLHYTNALEAQRRGYLLREEREVLSQCARDALGTQRVEVSTVPVVALLWTRVAAAAEERMLFVASAMEAAERRTTSVLAQRMQDMKGELWRTLLPLLMDGLYMSEAQYRARLLGRGAGGLEHLNALGAAAEGKEGHAQTAPQSTPDNDHTDAEPSPSPSVQSRAVSISPAAASATIATPPVVVSALYRLAADSSNLIDKVVIHAHEEHQQALRRVHREMSSQLEAIVHAATTQQRVVVEQHVTELRLDDLRADVRHQQFMRGMQLDREQKMQGRAERALLETKRELERAEAQISNLEHENAVLRERSAMAEAEVTLLRELTGTRQQSAAVLTQVREETRTLNYHCNPGTFGETWQESLLRLRERILSELGSDNARFLAKLRSFLKRKEVDHAQIESLYEARLTATVQRLNEENDLRLQNAKRRADAEIAALNDAHARTQAETRDACDKEKEASCRHFEAEYLERLRELNESYSARLRQLRARESEWEERLADSLRHVRGQFRKRENELEQKFADRYHDMCRVFEDDSNRCKEQFADRHRDLEHAHLQATAKLETQLNERTQAMQRKLEALAVRLQEDVLRFVGEKQTFFDAYRSTEMELIATFMQSKDKMVSERYQAILATQQATNKKELDAAHSEQRTTLSDVEATHAVEQARVLQEAAARVAAASEQREHTFRVSQDMQQQRDSEYWDRCREYLLHGETHVLEHKAQVEVELQRRYASLVDRCQSYLSKDMAAAREAFDWEMTNRYAALHDTCQPLLRIASEMQFLTWEEQQQRAFLARSQVAQFTFLLSSFDERRLKIQRREASRSVYGDHSSSGGLSVVSVDDLRALREKFDQRLAEEHAYVAHLSRDVVTSVEVSLEASHASTVAFQEAQQQQLQEVTRLVTQKAHLFEDARMRLVNDRLAQHNESVHSALHAQDSSRNTTLNASLAPAAKGNGARLSEHLVSVSSQFASVVESATEKWERQLREHDAASRRRQKDTFSGMHDEYVAATTSLLGKLERAQCDVADASEREVQLRSVIQMQSLEVRKAIDLVRGADPSQGIDSPTASGNVRSAGGALSVRQLHAATREAADVREKLFALEVASLA